MEIEWKDLYLSADEYFDICYNVAKDSDFFTDMNSEWHPEDLYYNMSTVTETVGKTLTEFMGHVRDKGLRRNPAAAHTSYSDYVKERMAKEESLKEKYETPKVPVFGGTIPESELDTETFMSNNINGEIF